MNPIELSWAAGLFEGEGAVRIDKPTARQRATLIVAVSNTDGQITEFFRARWGGSVRPVSGSGVGMRRPAWVWVAAALKAAAFLTDVLPYLRTERVRTKAWLGLEFQAQKGQGQSYGTRSREYRERQVAFYDEMRLLNKRGAGPDPEPLDASEYLALPAGWRRGEKNGNARLAQEQVDVIRAARTAEPPVLVAVLAERFGVSTSTISAVANGVTWRERVDRERATS